MIRQCSVTRINALDFLMISKSDTWYIKWCIYGITHLEITYVSVKCKLLQGESGKANSLRTYKPRRVHG